VKKFFKIVSTKNIERMRLELARAHFIIALLAFANIAVLSLGVSITTGFNPTLSAIASTLLVFLALISLSISLHLFTNKNK